MVGELGGGGVKYRMGGGDPLRVGVVEMERARAAEVEGERGVGGRFGGIEFCLVLVPLPLQGNLFSEVMLQFRDDRGSESQ